MALTLCSHPFASYCHKKARPAFARVIGEARRYRPYFPLGAPDRD